MGRGADQDGTPETWDVCRALTSDDLTPEPDAGDEAASSEDLDEIKAQLAELQKKLSKLS